MKHSSNKKLLGLQILIVGSKLSGNQATGNGVLPERFHVDHRIGNRFELVQDDSG